MPSHIALPPAERGKLYYRRPRRTRARTAENNAPAPPTSASTTVGFSGESVQPVCPYSGAATNTITAHARITTVDLFTEFLPRQLEPSP
jgi:hypothetical protein